MDVLGSMRPTAANNATQSVGLVHCAVWLLLQTAVNREQRLATAFVLMKM
jgi:hypothetical protein